MAVQGSDAAKLVSQVMRTGWSENVSEYSQKFGSLLTPPPERASKIPMYISPFILKVYSFKFNTI